MLIFEEIKRKGNLLFDIEILEVPMILKFIKLKLRGTGYKYLCDKNKLTDKGCNGTPDWIIEVVLPGSRQMSENIGLLIQKRKSLQFIVLKKKQWNNILFVKMCQLEYMRDFL